MKASVSDFKHKFYDECVNAPLEMPEGITAEDYSSAVAEINELFAKLLESCESENIEVLPPNMTEEEFLAWVRNHE